MGLSSSTRPGIPSLCYHLLLNESSGCALERGLPVRQGAGLLPSLPQGTEGLPSSGAGG